MASNRKRTARGASPALAIALGLGLFLGAAPAHAEAPKPGGTPAETPAEPRIIEADIVALDQAITYNRFGSINPYGMIFALRSDVVDSPSLDELTLDANGHPECIPAGETAIGDAPADLGAAQARNAQLAGAVQLRCTKRPRPLVLRGNVGDQLVIRLTNLLRPEAPDASSCDKIECQGPYPDFKQEEAPDPDDAEGGGPDGNWPQTRLVSLSIPGLSLAAGNADPACTALSAIAPGQTVSCTYDLTRQGSFLFSSLGAPAGGEADSGSAIHGLFGVVNVQPRHSRWYRSQVDAAALDVAWDKTEGDPGNPLRASAARPGQLNYDAFDMLDPDGGNRVRLRFGDINAIIEECADPASRATCLVGDSAQKPGGDLLTRAQCDALPGVCYPSFREFTVVFHDELKTFYAAPFTELGTERQFQGVGDGFAINYGASGMGSALLANRKGLGPAKDCVECVYEEFFLQSWANGDPALLENYDDDPSNVHHSYLNDRIVFRNLHVGKETHVFHLHAHQWESLPQDEGQGSYLDSQTIGPGQAFSYEIYRGGLRHIGAQGNFQTAGSGNRNRTVGDSIFHCHLYPHFAQGMWALWRVHDVVEDGSRRLPDGQGHDGLSYNWDAAAGTPRPGTNTASGQTGQGTPIPAVVPMPGQPLPPLPTYGPEGMPGYPFYIAGEAGHRAPQPPNDFAARAGADGGLPRHIITGGKRGLSHLTAAAIEEKFGHLAPHEKGQALVRRALALGDMTAELEAADIVLVPSAGTPLEQRAMAFHAGRAGKVRAADGTVHSFAGGRLAGYPTLLPNADIATRFYVNGSDPVPGAPFADPCKTGNRWDPGNPRGETRHYNVSAVQLDLVTNRDGWHDPQARINVLDRDVPVFEGQTRAADPFFFRAESGNCIVFNHSNRTPKDLELDDFQVATPTDTIGQHIHLVKFDVTSADGSGNGWNYEDGTFAPDAVLERLCASLHGSVTGGTLSVNHARCEAFEAAHSAKDKFALALDHHVQTTTQRWYADPLLGRSVDGAKGDRTLGTVFTHDHFAPSSIQQHGFYSALLIEPKGSTWRDTKGKKLPRKLKNSMAVGPAALITGANDQAMHPDHREFALAIADFATLYDPPCLPAPCATPLAGDVPNPEDPVELAAFTPEERAELGDTGGRKGLDLLVHELASSALANVVFPADRQRLNARRNQVRSLAGFAVAPPLRPEAISTDHHDPYLLNYKGEPIPLRIGERSSQSRRMSCDDLNAWPFTGFGHGNPVGTRLDISRRRAGRGGDPAYAMRSQKTGDTQPHGDPCTPILEAYEGEHAAIRLIQGAQEVQHVFTIDGIGWKRVPYFSDSSLAGDNPLAIRGAQEVGISEHLEFDIPGQSGLSAGQTSDYALHFGSQDAIWNGAWGLVRIHSKLQSQMPPLHGTQGLATVVAGNLADGSGQILLAPANAPTVHIRAVTASFGQISSGPRQHRDATPALYDPDGLILLPARKDEDRDAVVARHRLSAPAAPPVWRVNAGAQIKLTVQNVLLATLADSPGDALLPRITSINVDDPQADRSHDIGTTPTISFVLPVLPQFPARQYGNFIGSSARPLPTDGRSDDEPFEFQADYYAGLVDMDLQRSARGKPDCNRRDTDRTRPCRYEANGRPYAYGPLPLKPTGDLFGHLAHGLFGGVIIEPEGARVYNPADGSALVDQPGASLSESYAQSQPVAAIVCTGAGSETGPVTAVAECAGGKGFREFVLFYQDGLNLYRAGQDGAAVPVGDCTICDDSYDRGEKGVSYRSEPFWARLSKTGGAINEQSNLNLHQFPPDFFATSNGMIATPTFTAKAGETVKFRVIQPGGRARQRAFRVTSVDYPDTLPFAIDANGDKTTRFGSPASELMAPGKAITATATCVREGTYLYHDGPTHLFSGGVWGHFVVEPGDTSACAP